MLGLRSEASARFEKQLHPELAMRAQTRRLEAARRAGGRRLVPGTIDDAAEIPPPHVISLRGARADSLLGVAVDRDERGENLERLGFARRDRRRTTTSR